ncbi:hypothetical protein GQR58_029639 [Nymphon striatum]|nr:hypothetical protein GQR58_029639 [Nymphon striatum]
MVPRTTETSVETMAICSDAHSASLVGSLFARSLYHSVENPPHTPTLRTEREVRGGKELGHDVAPKQSGLGSTQNFGRDIGAEAGDENQDGASNDTGHRERQQHVAKRLEAICIQVSTGFEKASVDPFDRGPDGFGDLAQRSVGSQDDVPGVVANQEVGPERDHDEDQHEVANGLGSGGDVIGEWVGDDQADHRRDHGQRDRPEQDRSNEVVAQGSVGLQIPVVQIGAAKSVACRKGVDEHDEQWHREKDHKVRVCRQCHEQPTASLLSLVGGFELRRGLDCDVRHRFVDQRHGVVSVSAAAAAMSINSS